MIYLKLGDAGNMMFSEDYTKVSILEVRNKLGVYFLTRIFLNLKISLIFLFSDMESRYPAHVHAVRSSSLLTTSSPYPSTPAPSHTLKRAADYPSAGSSICPLCPPALPSNTHHIISSFCQGSAILLDTCTSAPHLLKGAS
jgi:hypothetical protein